MPVLQDQIAGVSPVDTSQISRFPVRIILSQNLPNKIDLSALLFFHLEFSPFSQKFENILVSQYGLKRSLRRFGRSLLFVVFFSCASSYNVPSHMNVIILRRSPEVAIADTDDFFMQYKSG